MKAAGKVGLVVAGYVVAALVAAGVVALYIAATSGPDRHTYGVMYDFGDSLLFLAVFGVVAALPTGAALFYLRSCRRCWPVLAVAALAVAATGLVAFIDVVVARTAAGAILGSWSPLAGLRILIAPLFVLAFGLAGLFAPSRSPRVALLAATLVEAMVFVGWLASIWLRSLHTR